MKPSRKALSSGAGRNESEALPTRIEKLEKIRGRQTIVIENLKNLGNDLREAVKPMVDKGVMFKSTCKLIATLSWDTGELGIQQIFCSFDNPRGNAETKRVRRTVKEECLWLN